MNTAVPYAMQELDETSPSGWVKVCPVCAERIPISERKDFESFTGTEYVSHYEAEHMNGRKSGLMAYVDAPADVLDAGRVSRRRGMDHEP